MELLKIAQYYNNSSVPKEKRRELLRKISVNYCISDKLPGKQQIREWAGYTTLHFAVQSNDLDLIVEFLNQGANIVKQGTKDGRTPLHLSSHNYFSFDRMQERLHSINALLSKQVETNNILNPKCKDGVSHLHIACMVNHAQAVEFFAKAKVPLDQLIDGPELQGYSPLHCAIMYASDKAAEILLQYGADIHVKNSKGMSCLQLLVERILDMNDCITLGRGKICLPYEEEMKKLQSIIRLVLNANDEVFVDDSGLSAFHVACTLRDKSIVQNYLKRGANVNQPVKSGSKFWPAWTPLHFAACIDVKMVLLLIENGANVTMRNLKGETPLDLCAKQFSPSDIRLILAMEDELRKIVLTDNCTKLLDLLETMNDFDKLGDFLHKLNDVNIAIPLDSPIWPGYNLLHLSVSLKEKTKSIEYSECCTYYYYTTEEELYSKRITLLLECGCDVNIKNANGQTPIHLAFSTNRESIVEKLLSHSEDNVIDSNGLFHLHIACVLGLLDAVKRYLSKGAEVNCRLRMSFNWVCWLSTAPIDVKPNSTPLHVATAFHRKNVVEYLLENGADVYARDSLGRTPIHLSMSVGRKGLGELFFEVTPDLQDFLSATDLSHLHVAAWVNNEGAMEDLLQNGAEVDRVVEADDDSSPRICCAGKTALLVALDSKAYESVEILLWAGANVHAKDFEGISALQHALRDMSSSTAAPFVRLVKSGKLAVDSCGMTLLHVACGTFDFEWAEKLLESGTDVNSRISDNGKLQGASPLYVLVDKTRFVDTDPDRRFAWFSDAELQWQFVRFVELLVDNGADVTAECCGRTPLHLMYDRIYTKTWREHLNDNEVAFALRAVDSMLKNQKSYDVNPTDDDGVSHFHLACLRNDVATATKFLDRGVDVNGPIDPFVYDIGGFTPLHYALTYRAEELVYLLLERGADVNAEDVRGNKPFHVALKNEFVDLPLIEAMLSRGADIHDQTLHGETLLYCLLGYGGLTLDALKFFLDHGCSINILDATNKSHQGIFGLAIRSAPPTELQPILELLVQVPEVKSAIQGDFNTIESIVSVKKSDGLTFDDYLSVIKLFVNTDYNLDQKNTYGLTALHLAAFYSNIEGVNALLQLGADINAVDDNRINSEMYDHCPFFNHMNDRHCQYEEDYDLSADMNVSISLARHVWKMRFNGLGLKETILGQLEKVEEEFSLIALLEQSCQNELTKARGSEICHGLTVEDFLSELGAVAEYPRMDSIQRASVDKYFKCTANLRQEFPEFCGLLALQYRKALARMDMWQPAKDAIISICQVVFPDLCSEAILRYFTNSEMKVMIEIVKDLD